MLANKMKIGCLMTILVANERVFKNKDEVYVCHFMNNSRTLAIPDYCTDSLMSLIHKCWDLNSQQRPSFNQIVSILESEIEYCLDSEMFGSHIESNSLLIKDVGLSKTDVKLLQNGMSFLLKFVGTVTLNISLKTLTQIDQTILSQACIAKLSHKHIEQYAKFFPDKEPTVVDKEIDFNINEISIRIIDEKVLHKILIQDVMLIAPKLENDLNNYFCLFIKSNANEKSFQCFVFSANTEVVHVCETILRAVKCHKQKINGIELVNYQSRASKLSNHSTHQIQEKPSFKQLIIFKNPSYKSFSNQKLTSSSKLVNKNLNNEAFMRLRSKSDPIQNDSEYENTVVGNKVAVNQKKMNGNRRMEKARPESVPISMTQEQFELCTQKLEYQSYFCGVLSRDVAETLIHKNGQFLVRQSTNGNREIVLTTMQDRVIRHICLVDREGFLWSNNGQFQTITQFIKYHYKRKFPLSTDQGNLILNKPVFKSHKKSILSSTKKSLLNILKNKI